jgi:hypothetical protein
MAQDDDFELPPTAAPGEHANDAAQKPIQQTHQHDAQSEPITSTAARRNRISLPHTHARSRSSRSKRAKQALDRQTRRSNATFISAA